MRRFRDVRDTLALVGLALVVGALPACQRSSEPGAPAEDRIPDPASLTVPDPDLSSMDPALARWLDDARDRVARQAEEATDDADPVPIGRAFGELGQLYYTFDRKDAAEATLRHATRLEPERFRWSYLLANTLAELGRLEEAREQFDRVLELRPDSLPGWLRLGDVQLDLGRPSEAAASYERALEIDPRSAAAHFGLGRAAAARDDPAAAVEHFERALELQPQASAVRYPLAQAYRELGRIEEAERELARRGDTTVPLDDPIGRELRDLRTLTAFQVMTSLAARPGDRTPEEILGFALTQLGDVRGTADQLEAAVERRREEGAPAEEMGRLQYVLGALRVQEGNDEQALEPLRRAVELAPELTDARVKLGNAQARRGRFDEAAAQYTEALEARPGDRELRLKRATAWVNLGRFADATRELERLLEQEPLDATAQVRLAEARELAGDPAGAAARYRRALELPMEASATARVHQGFGDFHRRNGNLDAALEQYRSAVELDPDLGAARRALAGLLGYQGRLEDAARHYAQATTRNPEDEAAWHGEAVAWLFAGEPGQARARLDEALEHLPASPELAHLLARMLAAAPEPEIRDGLRALELARSVYDQRPSPAAAQTVAMALAEQGRFAEAVEWQQRAVGGSAASGGDAWARLTLYRAGRPFRAESPEDYLPVQGE